MALYLNLSAAVLSLVWALVHFFVGGREIAQHLRYDTALAPIVRQTTWMCWHMVTATLFVIAILFALTVYLSDAGIGLAATIVAAGVAIAGLVSAPVLKTSYRVLPQGWLFVPIVALGANAYLAN